MSASKIPVRSNKSTPDKQFGSPMELQHALHLSRMQCAGLREIATKWEYELKQLREFSEFESMTIQSEVVINEPQPDPVLVASLKAQIQLLKKQKEALQENKLSSQQCSGGGGNIDSNENFEANQQQQQQPFNAARSMMIIDGLL